MTRMFFRRTLGLVTDIHNRKIPAHEAGEYASRALERLEGYDFLKGLLWSVAAFGSFLATMVTSHTKDQGAYATLAALSTLIFMGLGAFDVTRGSRYDPPDALGQKRKWKRVLEVARRMETRQVPVAASRKGSFSATLSA